MDEAPETKIPLVDEPSSEDFAAFVKNAFLTDDAGIIAQALGTAIHAKGIATIAAQTGLSVEQLEKSFNANGDPAMSEITIVMRALGIRFSVLPTAVGG